jgi:hypothetical protein
MDDIWFFKDGGRRAIETNAQTEDDFLWSCSLELAVMVAHLESANDREDEMREWTPLVGELAKRLRRGERSLLEPLRAGCGELTSEHLVHGGALQ